MSAASARHHMTVHGQGDTTIVLGHGFGCDQDAWRHLVPALAAHARVVSYDLMGCGHSQLSEWSPQRHGDLCGHAEDLLELLDELRAGPVHFVGHSVSASIGMLAAIKRPQHFTQLIMLCPNPCFVNHPGYEGGFEQEDISQLIELLERNQDDWSNFLAPLVMKNPDQPELANELRHGLCGGQPDITRVMAKLVFHSDVRQALASVATPSVVLQTLDDAVAPRSVGPYLCAQMPQARLIQMQASGHCPHMSHPLETLACIQAALCGASSFRFEEQAC